MAQSAQIEDIKRLEEKIIKSSMPDSLKTKSQEMVGRLELLVNSAGYMQEYDSAARYLDWITALPWTSTTADNLSLENAKKILDANHYGLEKIKERILEYIAVLSLKASENQKPKAPSLLLLGLVGTGKTTMAYSIAKTLGRQFGRIPMGGMGDALQLRGRSRSYPDSEPGQIIKVLRRTNSKNSIILLDEIDRVTEEAKTDIMGVLVELLDPEQNSNFLDHYLDYPFDLSQVLFIATANNTNNIATAVLDRLETLELPSYNDEQKTIIGKKFLFPRAIAASGLKTNEIIIDDNIWPEIVRPLGFDAGMRTLDRIISGICRKVAKLKIEGKITNIKLDNQNIKEFLPSY